LWWWATALDWQDDEEKENLFNEKGDGF